MGSGGFLLIKNQVNSIVSEKVDKQVENKLKEMEEKFYPVLEFIHEKKQEVEKAGEDAIKASRKVAAQISEAKVTSEQSEILAKGAEEIEKKEEKEYSAEDYLVLATEARSKKEYEDGLKFARAGLDLQPEDIRLKATLTHRLGSIYGGMGKVESEIKYYEEAVRLDPAFSWPHHNLGIIYHGQKNYHEAEKECKEAINLDPNFTGAHFNLGLVYIKVNKPEEALKEFEEADKLNPGDRATLYQIKSLRKELGL